MAELGFIGLGIMGKPMAANLLKAGHKVYVYDIMPKSVSELHQQGAIACTSSKEVPGRLHLYFLLCRTHRTLMRRSSARTALPRGSSRVRSWST